MTHGEDGDGTKQKTENVVDSTLKTIDDLWEDLKRMGIGMEE